MAVVIRPIQEHENDAVYQMFQDIPERENEATNHAHGMSRGEFDDFCKKNVANSDGQRLPEGKVPQTMYIIFDNDIPVGFGKFRPILNDVCIKNRAGHFAYMISPKHRRKGYATAFMEFVKNEAMKVGLTEIEGAAIEGNVASCGLMEKMGGKVKQRIDGDVVYTIALQRRSR